MEAIRVATTTGNLPATPSSASDLPGPGENIRLQRLAAWNLSRLLWMEYTQGGSNNATNPSKALAKVTQNLAKYILPDELDEWGECPSWIFCAKCNDHHSV